MYLIEKRLLYAILLGDSSTPIHVNREIKGERVVIYLANAVHNLGKHSIPFIQIFPVHTKDAALELEMQL